MVVLGSVREDGNRVVRSARQPTRGWERQKSTSQGPASQQGIRAAYHRVGEDQARSRRMGQALDERTGPLGAAGMAGCARERRRRHRIDIATTGRRGHVGYDSRAPEWRRRLRTERSGRDTITPDRLGRRGGETLRHALHHWLGRRGCARRDRHRRRWEWMGTGASGTGIAWSGSAGCDWLRLPRVRASRLCRNGRTGIGAARSFEGSLGVAGTAPRGFSAKGLAWQEWLVVAQGDWKGAGRSRRRAPE